MPKVAVVRLRYAAKDYWFDPNGFEPQEGDHVVVETVRGREIGLCSADCREVSEGDISSPLKPVVRLATDDDLAQADKMSQLSEEAMTTFRELVEKHELDMKPVRVEFTFSGDFATFYFAADERIDFRSLVRDLASEFHVRVDMRQIGARDEARMLGGLGHCGEELCCTRMGGEFQPVSIRMAKEQDLPLNPSKISGLCGRLMCCLRYEFEAYKDFKSRSPKKNAVIDTPAGLAKVVEFDTPRERIKLRMEDGSTMFVPLEKMDTEGKEAKPGENVRPCHIGQEAWDEIIEDLHNDTTLAMMGDKLFSDDNALADKVVEGGHLSRNEGHGKHGRIAMGSEKTASSSSRSRRSNNKKKEEEPQGRNVRNRRRSVAVNANTDSASEQAQAPAQRKPRRRSTAAATRPQASQANQEPKQQKPATDEAAAPAKKRRRRRRGGSNKSGSTQQQQAQQQGEQQQKPKQANKPRPGQNSSTLHGTNNAAKEQPKQQNAGEGGQAKKRRRRRKRSGNGNGGSGEGKPNTTTSAE